MKLKNLNLVIKKITRSKDKLKNVERINIKIEFIIQQWFFRVDVIIHDNFEIMWTIFISIMIKILKMYN